MVQKQKMLRRSDKNTQNCTKKKCLNDLDNHDAVVTHLEQDMLELSQEGLGKHYYEQN